ncbi:Unknown protein, partial [Striga hermonthica]
WPIVDSHEGCRRHHRTPNSPGQCVRPNLDLVTGIRVGTRTRPSAPHMQRQRVYHLSGDSALNPVQLVLLGVFEPDFFGQSVTFCSSPSPLLRAQRRDLSLSRSSTFDHHHLHRHHLVATITGQHHHTSLHTVESRRAISHRAPFAAPASLRVPGSRGPPLTTISDENLFSVVQIPTTPLSSRRVLPSHRRARMRLPAGPLPVAGPLFLAFGSRRPQPPRARPLSSSYSWHESRRRSSPFSVSLPPQRAAAPPHAPPRPDHLRKPYSPACSPEPLHLLSQRDACKRRATPSSSVRPQFGPVSRCNSTKYNSRYLCKSRDSYLWDCLDLCRCLTSSVSTTYDFWLICFINRFQVGSNLN